MYCDTINLPHCQMTVYIPDLVADPAVRRPTIVIAPGGGYTHLSTRESEPIALTFAAMGMNAVVVRYRVAPAVFPAPMQDIASAVAAIRQNAEKWHADPNQIALCGFSAGAHAVGLLGVHWQEAHWWQEMHLTSADVPLAHMDGRRSARGKHAPDGNGVAQSGRSGGTPRLPARRTRGGAGQSGDEHPQRRGAQNRAGSDGMAGISGAVHPADIYEIIIKNPCF